MFFRLISAGAGLALCLEATMAQAAGPAPFPQFEARRVGPPAAGARRRITVQIEPAETKAAETSAKTTGETTAEPPSPLRYAWFWDSISPDIAVSGPGRLEPALRVLSGTGGVSAPRLQAMQDIARARGTAILRSTVGTRVSPALVLAVIAVESSGDAAALSPDGAQGLMQLMPDTATRFGVADALAPDDNIAGGVRYLDWLMDEFDGDPILVLAGYNAGAGAVRDNGGVPPYPETRDYVPKVLAAFRVARGLCASPPELISDGCVFVGMD